MFLVVMPLCFLLRIIHQSRHFATRHLVYGFRYEFNKAAADQISNCHSRDYAEGSRELESCLNASNLVPAVDNGELYCRYVSV